MINVKDLSFFYADLIKVDENRAIAEGNRIFGSPQSRNGRTLNKCIENARYGLVAATFIEQNSSLVFAEDAQDILDEREMQWWHYDLVDPETWEIYEIKRCGTSNASILGLMKNINHISVWNKSEYIFIYQTFVPAGGDTNLVYAGEFNTEKVLERLQIL